MDGKPHWITCPLVLARFRLARGPTQANGEIVSPQGGAVGHPPYIPTRVDARSFYFFLFSPFFMIFMAGVAPPRPPPARRITSHDLIS